MRSRWIASLAFVVAATLGVAPASAAGVSKSRDRSGHVVAHGVKTPPGQSRKAWTAGDMKHAKSKPLKRIGRSDLTNGFIQNSQSQTAIGEAIVPSLSSEEPTFTSGAVSGDYTAYPERTSGKVFYRDQQGGEWVCSGTAVTSQNRSVVSTAAHCVHGGPGSTWVSDWIFVPAYRDGRAPFGVWPAVAIYTTEGWLEQGLFNFDMAAVVVAPDTSDDRLTDLVGGREVRWNDTLAQDVDAYGYPAADPFNGEKMRLCSSSTTSIGNAATPTMLAIGCDMRQGASGGGWITNDGFLNSVTSAGSSEHPGILFGPYFGAAAADIFTAASLSTAPGPLPSSASSPSSAPESAGTVAAPAPEPSSSPSITALAGSATTRRDANDSPGSLDVRRATVGLGSKSITTTLETFSGWRPGILRTSLNNIYFDFDVASTEGPEYYGRISLQGGELVGQLNQYSENGSSPVGFGTVRKINERTVEMTFDRSLFADTQTIRWSARTQYRSKSGCPNVCWDIAPNKGFIGF